MPCFIRSDDWKPSGVAELSTEAWSVVQSDYNSYVIAGPGAGKTELLAQRACYLLQTNTCRSPRRILAISYTRSAAAALRDRVRDRSGQEFSDRFDSMTFDAFAKGLLDRFRLGVPSEWRPRIDYELKHVNDDEIGQFIRTSDIPSAQAVTAAGFIRKHVVWHPLPLPDASNDDPASQLALRWWANALRPISGPSWLCFPMVERLAQLALFQNPLVLKALRASYSHVFLDEFQDATLVQYGLLATAFRGTSTVVTAVGDDKQRIMTWAGALEDAFNRFAGDFGAQRHDLTTNYRSSPQLQGVQRTIASAIDGHAAEIRAPHGNVKLGGSCEIREYDTVEREAADIAKLVGELRAGGVEARDIALLVRQKPGDYTPMMAEAFERHDLRMRDERAFHDLAAERLTQAVLPHLRLACAGRSAESWDQCVDVTVTVWGASPDIDGPAVDAAIDTLRKTLWKHMANDGTDEAVVREVLDHVYAHLGEGNLRAYYREYSQGGRYGQIKDNLAATLAACLLKAADWSAALDEFEGVDIVPLSTIHQSKGLEFDTVIFIGLDDRAWWSFVNDEAEGRSTFFVAFSRAKRRVLFTYCEARGKHHKIQSLYDLLRHAGVPTRTVS